MDDGVKKFCPNCSQLYNLQINLSSKPKGNLPLLLPCGHSMCENCIVNTVKCLEPIECKVCMCDANVKINDLNTFILDKNVLYLKFPINVHMVGELAVNQMKDSYSTRKQPDDDFFIDLKTLLNCAAEQGNCVECGVATSKMCKECVTILCDACFNKTHKNYIVFKNHVLQSIETTMLPSTCKQHLQKPLDYYCKDCKKCVCTDCMILGGEKSCKNHDVVSLQDINETFLEDLNEISPKVDETYRRLTKTAVDVGYLLYNFQNDAGSAKDLTNILADVEQHFSKLFSIIQKHKEEIVNIILYLKFSEKNSLQRAKSEIANSIKKANNVLELIAIATDTKNIKRINMPALLEEAKEVVNTPWYLDKKETDKEPLKVTVNEDLCSLVSDYVHLEGNVKSVYKMYSTAELGDNVEIPPAPATPVLPPELVKDARLSKPNKPKPETPKAPALFTNAPKYRNKSGSVSSNSNCSEKSNRSYIVQNQYQQPPIVQPVAPFQENQHPQQLSEGAQELIYVTHIVDPHNFFVQRACFQRLVKDMVREFRNAVSFAKPSVNHIAPGKTYLAFNKADNMWQRCRILGIDMKPNKTPVVQVFCFDFGSIEFISADKLRLLPPSKIQCPYPLAINCSLANCEPRSGKWTNDDSFLIQNIIDNKQAVLHVRRIIPLSNVDFKLDCDVTTFENGVSVAHALVFHERAKMPNPKLWYPKIMGVDEIPKLYNSSELKSEEEVYITHVINPDKFYVRKHHLQEIYDKLTEELEQEYSLASTTGTVYLPEIGKVYAVNLEKSQEEVSASWARGVATELPGHKRVRVRLPDCGRSLLLHWSSLRYLQTKFTTLSALAIECHLAGITPPNKQWSKVSVEFFKKYQGTLLELHVEDNRNKGRHNRGSVGVTLYDKSDTENSVCINNEMIKHKFGVSFGIYKFNTSPEEQVVTNKSPLIEPKPSKPQKNKITILKKEMPEKVKSPESMDDINLQAKDKGPLRLEAKVLNYQSPSHIYISLVHQQKTFNELFEKMQKYYSKSNKNKLKEDWKIGDRCSTLCQQSQTWRRTIIMELKDDNAKLFYSDFACVETVPISRLKELPQEFSKIGDAAIKCHLSGIMPAVGDEWPLITKEYLKELLDGYKRIFVTKMGTFKDKSMPIQLWVYHTEQGGALEPNKSTWRCLNEKILEQGLCVPDQSQAVPTDNNAEDSQDMLSFLNITGSVNEWLLLEPLPMIPFEKEKVDSGSKTNSPSPSEENEDDYYVAKENPSPSNVMYVTDWLPPEPLNCREFTALPTYIDNDGIIYLHDISQQDTLDLIRKALDVRFKDPDPKAKFTKWSVGEPCVALFFLDNRYYRGRVIEVNKETSMCVIHYIDYGNEESCSFENLRKSVPLHQIPTQAHKCVLNRICPVGKQWDRQTLDYIHKSIVEKKCFVKVVGDAVNGVIPIELKYDKLWINDHLVDFELAKYKDGTKAPVMKYCPVEKNKKIIQEDTTQYDSGPDYVVDDPDTDQLSSCQNSFDVSLLKLLTGTN
ncbi:unnamed protein product [Spodoptera littoralis]|uniref:RING finger protein 17 n=1 Tax=Spodoptera littoralis TaxID=7109 RepID=A0A9P0HXD6_SPOLI|nr:unnamed protein product [Spodoptera littoralis]CAH1635655.1 unnamed protein product [Spodoptera littoralis]